MSVRFIIVFLLTLLQYRRWQPEAHKQAHEHAVSNNEKLDITGIFDDAPHG
jgi:hypothetical protein